MARRLYTVEDIARSVRARIDEMNRDSVDTERDIVPALNRALEYATDIYARIYPDPYIAYESLDLVNGQAEYDIPDDVYEDRLVKVDVKVTDNTYNEVQRVSYQNLALYETESKSNTPFYYAIIGRKIRLVPRPLGGYDLRLWFVKNPEQLVLPQGRITLVQPTGQYLVVDNVGSDLSTESDSLSNYINVINFRTGEIKATYQIASIDGSRIYIRTSPSQTTSQGRDIATTLVDTPITRDDYICLSTGTCVPYLASPTTNFIIQFAIAEISRQLGINSVEEEQVLAKFEKQVQTTWAGREVTTRVVKRSGAYGTPVRRWTLTQKSGGS